MAESTIKKDYYIKSKTITGTTDSSGNICLEGISLNYSVISIACSNGYPTCCSASNNKYYVKIVNNSNPIGIIANTSLTLYIKYI